MLDYTRRISSVVQLLLVAVILLVVALTAEAQLNDYTRLWRWRAGPPYGGQAASQVTPRLVPSTENWPEPQFRAVTCYDQSRKSFWMFGGTEGNRAISLFVSELICSRALNF